MSRRTRILWAWARRSRPSSSAPSSSCSPIFGVIHHKAPAGFAGVAIGLVVFAAIIPVAPTTGASINPARTFGPMLVQQIAGGTVQWEQLPVYIGAEVLAGIVAALAYGALVRGSDAVPQSEPAQAESAPALADTPVR